MRVRPFLLPLRAPAQAGAPFPNIVLCEITRTLRVRARGEDVRCLQRYLNQAGFQLAASGAGSPGNESRFFGPRTKAAVVRWQESHRAGVLTPVGLAKGSGIFGPASFSWYVTLVRTALGVR